MNERRSGINAGTVTAVAATVTAIAAVVVAVWDNVQTRRHNRLSVLPRLAVTSYRVNGNQASVRLSNHGIGPAIVRDVTIRFRRESGQDTTFSTFLEARDLIQERGVTVTGYRDMQTGSAVGIDQELKLLSFVRDTETAADTEPDPIGDVLDRLGVAVDYTSVYEDPFRAVWHWEDRPTPPEDASSDRS